MPQLLPHGWYSLLPPVLATCAWTCSLFQDGCDYATLQDTNPNAGPSVVQDFAAAAPYLELGFDAYREPIYDPTTQDWQIDYSSPCLEYPSGDDGANVPVDVNNDVYWTTSKFLDFIADVLGGAGAFFLWFATCCIFSKGTWRWTGYELALAAICQGLNFLWFRNELCAEQPVACSMSWGAKMDIVASSLWAVAAILILMHYPQAEWNYEDDDYDDGSYEEDGDPYSDHPSDDDDDANWTNSRDSSLSPETSGFAASYDTDSGHAALSRRQQVSGEPSYEDDPRGMHAKIV